MFKFFLIAIPAIIIGGLIFLGIDELKENKKRKINNKKIYLSNKNVEDISNPIMSHSKPFYSDDLKEFWQKRLAIAEKRQEYIKYYLYCIDNNIRVPKTYYCKRYKQVSNFNKADVLKVYRFNDQYIHNIKTLSLYDLSYLNFFTIDESNLKNDMDIIIASYLTDYEIDRALGIFITLKKFYNDNH